MSEKGERVCTVDKERPECSNCGETLKKNEFVYYCSSSKKVYCNKCEHNKNFKCDNSRLMDEHTDWLCQLEIKPLEVQR